MPPGTRRQRPRRARVAAQVLMALAGASVARAYQKIDLERVGALTFRRGLMTTGRRSSPVPQLSCVGGDCSYEPDVVQCRNVGVDSYGEVQWACTAQLPEDFDLGATDVVCEGYSSRDDPFILAGSCGLEYTLTRRGGRFSTYGSYPYRSARSSGNWMSSLVSYAMMGTIGWLIYSVFMAPSNGGPRRAPRDGRSGGWGGGYDGWGGGGGGGGGGWGSGWGSDNSCEPRSNRRGTSGPGFWSGLGLGALGASMARGFGGGNRWNSGGGYRSHGGYNSGYSSGRSGGGGGGHTSSGFGGTRRR